MSKGNQYTIKEAIQALMKQYGIDDKYRETRVLNKWPEVMGKTIAKHTTNIYIKNGCLYVYLDSAPLKQELTYAREKIRERLNEEAGDEVVESVVIR